MILLLLPSLFAQAVPVEPREAEPGPPEEQSSPPTAPLPPDTPPVLSQGATPTYPPQALSDRVTGTVVLRLNLDQAGQVVEATVLRGLREDVDLAALEAAKKLRFQPATHAGVPAPSSVDYAFSFTLKVEDQTGNPVPGTVRINFVDAEELEVPGAVLTLVHTDGSKKVYQANDLGIVDASFLQAGEWKAKVEKDGFALATFEFTIEEGQTRSTTVELVPLGPSEEVVVVGVRQRWREVERSRPEPSPEPITGSYTLTRRDVESTPGALEDVSRAVHKLPGVVSDGDMLGTFSVRGATPSEVVFVLDRVPLDNPFHLAGFNSIFNPDMLAEVRFFAGTPPADVPAGTSAVMEVTSWDGAPKDDRHDLDGAIDLSMSGARALLMGPIGKGDDLTFAFAARRSYIEAYFSVMKAANLLDQAIAAPEFDELSARLAWRPGQHRLLLSLLRAGDHLKLVDSADESTININGNFELENVLYLTSLDHLWTAPSGLTGQSTVSWSMDDSHMARDFAGATSRDVTRQQFFARSDWKIPLGKAGRLETGAAGTLRFYDYGGPVEDNGLFPSFVSSPIGDYGLDFVQLQDPEPQGTVAGYLQHAWDGPVRTRAGVRSTWVQKDGRFLLSPSLGLSVPLPTATVPKISAGLYQRVIEEPLLIDPVFGNPDLLPERSAQVVVGLDQGLPIGQGGLLRIEGYYAKLDQLAVTPDDPGVRVAGESYLSVGSGHNMGVDLLFALRSERISGALNASYVDSWRINPLNATFPQRVRPKEWQPLTLGLSLEWQAAPAWRLTARYDYHTGRPMSSVEAGPDDTLLLTGLNDTRLGDFHQLDLRAEWRKALPRVRWSVYLEVLNVTYARSDFMPIASVEDGELTMSMFSHLPTRPFLGVRADF